MKRYTALYIFALLGIACTKVDNLEPVHTDDGMAVAFRSSRIGTRTSYEDASDAIHVTWNAMDKVGMFSAVEGKTTGSNIAYKALTSGAEVEFVAYDTDKIIKWSDSGTPHGFYAIYPYQENGGDDYRKAKVSLPARQSQTKGTDRFDHLAEYDILYAGTEGVRQDDYEEVPLQFKHLFAMVDVAITPSNDMRTRISSVILRCKDNSETIAFTSAEADLSTGEINYSTVQGGASEIELECGFLTDYYKAAQHFYFTLTPGHEGKEFEIAVVLSNGEECTVLTRTAPAGGFKPAIYMLSGEFTPTAEEIPVNLSSEGTANTYIVTERSMLYSFKGNVKGNGMNREYYTETSEQNLSIEPKSVLVLWYNCMQTNSKWQDMSPVCVDRIKFKDGIITIETPAEFVEGNAVIAAFAEEGLTYENIEVDGNGLFTNATMLWSWNIWAVSGYNPETCSINVGSYELMDRNLGALRNELAIDGTEAFFAPMTIGNSYQWGRKDPFPYHADSRNYYPFYYSLLATTPTYTPIKALQHTVTDKEGTVLQNQIFSNEGATATGGNFTEIGYAIKNESYSQSIELAVRNPHKFISDKESRPSWVYNQESNEAALTALWGDPTADGKDDALKSIYDPCPPGWRLWTRQTLMAIKEHSETEAPERLSNYGVQVAGSYFPFTGGGRSAQGNNMFGLGWVVQPQATMPFIGWTATAECFKAYGQCHQMWYEWNLGQERDGYPFNMGDTPVNGSTGYAVARPVRCIKMGPEVSFGGDGGMTGEDGKEEHGWYE
ncbi:MAG: fimbrillin family protein [Clostridium sp.]|nr:fimbrillin family protein [Bacteroides sp.]MCM1197425.1 fimbrillin family protein [Clostridium sp.]